MPLIMQPIVQLILIILFILAVNSILVVTYSHLLVKSKKRWRIILICIGVIMLTIGFFGITAISRSGGQAAMYRKLRAPISTIIDHVDKSDNIEKSDKFEKALTELKNIFYKK